MLLCCKSNSSSFEGKTNGAMLALCLCPSVSGHRDFKVNIKEIHPWKLFFCDRFSVLFLFSVLVWYLSQCCCRILRNELTPAQLPWWMLDVNISTADMFMFVLIIHTNTCLITLTLYAYDLTFTSGGGVDVGGDKARWPQIVTKVWNH